MASLNVKNDVLICLMAWVGTRVKSSKIGIDQIFLSKISKVQQKGKETENTPGLHASQACYPVKSLLKTHHNLTPAGYR